MYDLHAGNPKDVKLAIDALAKPNKDEEPGNECILILISSLLAWDRTPKNLEEIKNPNEPDSEEEGKVAEVKEEGEKAEGVHGNRVPFNFNSLPLFVLFWGEAIRKQLPLLEQMDNCCPATRPSLQKSKADFVGNWPQFAVSLTPKANALDKVKHTGFNLVHPNPVCVAKNGKAILCTEDDVWKFKEHTHIKINLKNLLSCSVKKMSC